MSEKNHMPIREFSRLTGIKPANLRFYDQIGLLSPETRGENGYRYYSRRQLNSAYLISDLRELGVGLEEINRYAADRSPEKMLALFSKQDERIQKEIERLREIRHILKLHADMAHDALRHGESALLLEEREREALFLCPPIPAGMDEEEGSIFSYAYAGRHGIHLGYPLGAIVRQDDFTAGCTFPASRFYFKTHRRRNAWKPAGLYAVAYARCDVPPSEEVYHRLLHYIREQNLRPCGDVYEEYPLDEMAVQDTDRFGIRLEVPVQRVT